MRGGLFVVEKCKESCWGMVFVLFLKNRRNLDDEDEGKRYLWKDNSMDKSKVDIRY